MQESRIARRVAQTVATSPNLQQAIKLEPSLMDLLTDAATPQPNESRWHRYTALKTAGQQLVGWSAREQALRTTVMHQAFTDALDELLPDPDIENEIA